VDRPELPTDDQVVEYNRLVDLLESAYKEIADLAKKRPDVPLGSLQVRMTNKILEPLRSILGLSVDADFLPLLDPTEEPSNADAAFVVGQYRGAVGTFRGQFHFRPENEYAVRWVTVERPGRVPEGFDGGSSAARRR
jgi:hypothetical protein